MPVVDVKDVAFCHVSSLINEDISNGKRYLCVGYTLWVEDINSILKDEFEKFGYKFASMTVGTTIYNIASIFDS